MATAPLAAEGVEKAPTSVNEATTPRILSVRKINPTTVEVTFSNHQTATFDFYGKNIFRLFIDSTGNALRNPVAQPPAQILVDRPRKEVGTVTWEENRGNEVLITTDRLLLHIDRHTGMLRVTDRRRNKEVIREIEPAVVEKNRVKLTLAHRAEEYFYGGGVQNGRFSHRGKTIAIENTNNWVDGGVASPTPYYWSTEGYAVMFHTFKPGKYDFGQTKPEQVVLTHNASYLDVFFMVSEKPTELLADFYQLTGNPVLLPKFAFYQGHLNAYNRDYWKEDPKGNVPINGKLYTESQKDNGGIKESLNGENDNYPFSARAAIDRYVDNDMPLGWFLPNDGYGAGYGQTGSIDGNIANLRQFTDYAKSKGVEVGLWTQSDLYPKEGIEPLLQRDIIKEVRDAGVRVLKTDVAWVGAGYSFGLNGVADVAKIMPQYGANARPFIISLDGWAGTQRYAGIWTGDQTGGEWEYIRFHIPTFIGSGLSGQPNITSDVDGIFGGRNKEVNVREFQWKTFTPMQLNMDGWGSTPKYPDAFDEEATRINRSYLKLKSRLMPYAYTAAKEAVSGRPMIRPMFMEEANRFTLGTATRYQFMYGDAFLVAPIYDAPPKESGQERRRHGIYLPKGTWIDYFTGDVYPGDRIINSFAAPLWKLPVFVKADAIIPVTHNNNAPAFIRSDYRAYEIYASAGTSITEYDDDGTTEEYLTGKAATTTLTTQVKKGKLLVEIAPTKGGFTGFQPEKKTELTLHTTHAPKKVTALLGGKKVRLRPATSLSDYEQHDNVYFYQARPQITAVETLGETTATGVKDAPQYRQPQLFVKLASTDITKQATTIEVSHFAYRPASPLLRSVGKLSTPEVGLAEVAAHSITPSWTTQPQTDFYEVEFDGMLYSTIREPQLRFDDLQPEHDYTFKVRAVNASGASDWALIGGKTKADPLQHAVKGATAIISCANQGGHGIDALFDHDEKSMWHTKWGTSALPFTLTIDLKGINELERFVYLPREDAGNGTILEGTYALSTDRTTWTPETPFTWERSGAEKTIQLGGQSARYLRLSVSKAAGGFGSGRELYVFRVPGTEPLLQGDINRDKRIDDNDLTSYMNYTGLRKGDADFDYVAIGDIDGNGLIDAFDISHVTTLLDDGAQATAHKVAGALVLTTDRTTVNPGEEVRITVSGQGLQAVNALSFALPYAATDLEFVGIEAQGTKNMTNLTYDRLHTNGEKVLYPTFVNRGHQPTLSGDADLFVLRFRAKRKAHFSPKAVQGVLVDTNLGKAAF